ncbi:2,3-diaminopropionate biosynthesis protein SbnA [Streptomyces sp. NPDC007088]|uniref:2,3-diaminopropionate biosynthesis protein SbnA n=1 Tax=Streptomyces sp. NPDC007088 TaxID=3364773 RepID=UPI00368AA900
MPIISEPQDYHEDDLFVDLHRTFGRRLYLKCEGFNFAGSIKLKAARAMVEAAEDGGVLHPGSVLVESSSGNLGVALSILAASKGYGFVCVTDSRANLATKQLIEAMGGTVHTVTEPAAEGGFLGARLRLVKELCESDDRHVWLNQYANPNNALAHYWGTAPAIAERFPDLEVAFIGAGTTGTLMGCARYFKENCPDVKVVAIDAVGSVTFGGPSLPRQIPGLGTGVRPPLLDRSYVDDVVHVSEVETIRACRRLARRGFLFGGSTGTVISGALRWLDEHAPGTDVTAVAVAPDMGDRYLDSIYHRGWVEEIYGSATLAGEFEKLGEVPLMSTTGVA